MTIQQFAEDTFRVIADGGFKDHIPTVIFPERRHIAALEDVPHDIDLEDASREWAKGLAQGGEEYLVVFKVDAMHFKVVRHFAGSFEDAIFKIPDA